MSILLRSFYFRQQNIQTFLERMKYLAAGDHSQACFLSKCLGPWQTARQSCHHRARVTGMPTLPSSAAGQRKRTEHTGVIPKAPRKEG